MKWRAKPIICVWLSCVVLLSSVFVNVSSHPWFIFSLLNRADDHSPQIELHAKDGDSSVGRAFDWNVRHDTDAGSSPRCGKGFFSQSQLPVQTLYLSTCIDICVHVKNPQHWQPQTPLSGQRNLPHTLTGTGSAAFSAAVPYPGKATWSSRKKQRSTKKKQM